MQLSTQGLADVYRRASSGGAVTVAETRALLEANSEVLDFADLLPLTLPLDGKPMDVLTRRPMFAPLFRRKRRARRMIFLCGRQIGKALALDTPIPTPTGWTTMGEIKVGDWVLGEDGKPTQVTFVTDVMQGHECFKLTFDDGETVIADADHLWKVSCSSSPGQRRGKPRIVTTKEWIALQPKKKKDRRFSIVATHPLRGTRVELPIEPYTLGVWLGDGRSMGGSITSSLDEETEKKKYIQREGFQFGATWVNPDRPNVCDFTVKGLHTRLSQAGLRGNKHIPAVYLRASIKQRLRLLRGLMDTDGCVRENGGCEITQKLKSLALGIQELLASLGIKSRLNEKWIRRKEWSEPRLYWTVGFATCLQVFSLHRKAFAHRWNTDCHPKNKRHYVAKIESVPSVPVRCIRVDNDSHMFLCGRSMIPTHNTASEAGSLLMNALYRDQFKVAYLAPLALYVSRFNHKFLQPMIQGNYLPWKIQDRTCVNNVAEKTFTNGSYYFAASAYNSIRGLLGGTADLLLNDEVQDLNVDFIPQAREILRTSDYRYETYMGTARGVENTINVLFCQSSMNRWHMRCRHCGKDNVAVDGESLKMIQPTGIGCMYCSTEARPRLLDTAEGIFIPEYPERVTKFDGYQIPQIIVADSIRADRYVDTIYDKVHGVEAYPESKVLEEIMGIPSEGGGRPVTPEQIATASILPYNDRDCRPPLHEYSAIAGGADWGGNGSSETSFTVGTLVGYHPANARFEVFGAIRPLGTAAQHAFVPVADYFKMIAGEELNITGADGLFVGPVQNPRLAGRSGVPCASVVYGSLKTLFKAHPGNFYTADRSTLLYVIFELVVAGKLVFPKDEAFKRFTKDLTAVVVEDVENKSNGSVARRYARISTMPDDFLHALAYGVFACSRMVALDLTAMVGLGSNVSINRASAVEIGQEE